MMTFKVQMWPWFLSKPNILKMEHVNIDHFFSNLCKQMMVGISLENIFLSHVFKHKDQLRHHTILCVNISP